MSDERIGRGAWTTTLLLCWAPAAAAGGALALAPFVALAGLIGAPFRAAPALARRGGLPLLFFALFIVWTMLSSAWSPAPKASLGRLAIGVAAGLALVAASAQAGARGRALIRAATGAAIVMLASLLMIEALFGMPLNRLAQPDMVDWALAHNPGTGVAVFLLLAGCGVLALVTLRLRWLAFCVCACAPYLVFQFDMNANVVALPVALACAAAAYARPRPTLTVIGASLAAFILIAPLIARTLPPHPPIENDLPFSWDHRLEIWRSSAARIGQAPLFGHGFDSARTMGAPILIHDARYIAIPLHPHNIAMQIWLELGAIGAILAAAALFTTGRALGERLARERAFTATLAGGVAVYALHACISYGMWQEWWVASAFLFAALLAAQWPRTAP